MRTGMHACIKKWMLNRLGFTLFRPVVMSSLVQQRSDEVIQGLGARASWENNEIHSAHGRETPRQWRNHGRLAQTTMHLKVFPMWLAIAEQEGLKAGLNIESLDFDIAGGRGFHGARHAPPSRGKEGDKGQDMTLRGAPRGKDQRQTS